MGILSVLDEELMFHVIEKGAFPTRCYLGRVEFKMFISEVRGYRFSGYRFNSPKSETHYNKMTIYKVDEERHRFVA